MLVTAQGYNAITARIELPRVGAWFAFLSLDAPDTLLFGSGVSIVAGNVTFTGTRYRGGGANSRINVVIAGGKGKLGTALVPRGYVNVSIGAVLADIANDSGEVLATNLDPVLMATVLPRWTRMRGTAGAALTSLGESVGASWRTQPDGTIRFGVETWPATTASYLLLTKVSRDRKLELDVPGLDLLPGTMVGSRSISRVVHIVDETIARTYAYYD